MPVSKALPEFADNIATPCHRRRQPPMHANEDHSALAKFHPLNRIAETSDIVDAVLYLQNATFVTGENIHVDGGFHAGR
jgi:NAD(P)-dependent dehydrogenase (short-subunit alcohol dehydrogenase family)